MSKRNEIEIAFDDVTQDYYAFWKPIAIGAGKTKNETLQDLKQAAHFGVDTFIDLKVKDISTEKED